MAHPPRIPIWLDAARPVVYFVTMCVAGRRPVLANDNAFAAFAAACSAMRDWHVLAAVIMPDHLHLLAAPADRDAAVGSLSAGIKRAMRGHLAAAWHWQPGSFDRLLRSDESASAKWDYIRDNPVRAGLVDRWDLWPYRIGLDDSFADG